MQDRDEVARLHVQMDHVARTLWDVQKTRIMVHNRLAGLEREQGADIVGLATTEHILKQQEEALDRALAKLASDHPLAVWVRQTRGIGLPGFARLMGLTGPLDRFGTPAKLWKYLGLGLVGGEVQRRRAGEPWTHTECKHEHLQTCPSTCRTEHHPDCRPGVEGTAYSPQGRVVMYQLIAACVGVGGPYRAVYDEAKARYASRERTGLSQCPTGRHHRSRTGKTMRCPQVHIDMLARRYAAKRLARDLWIEWRKAVTVGSLLSAPLDPQPAGMSEP